MACYRSLDKPGYSRKKIKQSTFLGYARYCSTEEEIDSLIKELREEHSNASHLCWAYRKRVANGLREYCTDAGEPPGTAGKPILGAMKKRYLEDVMVAVVRYFGGIKLGIRGLIEAYGFTADEALDEGVVVLYCEASLIRIVASYGAWNHFQRTKEHLRRVKIISADYGSEVVLSVGVRNDEKDELISFFKKHNCLVKVEKSDALMKIPL